MSASDYGSPSPRTPYSECRSARLRPPRARHGQSLRPDRPLRPYALGPSPRRPSVREPGSDNMLPCKRGREPERGTRRRSEGETGMELAPCRRRATRWVRFCSRCSARTHGR